MDETRTPMLSILIVSYNTRDLTLACLGSVLRETKSVRYEIIVVDNASTDGSADAIATHPARARLIRLERNIGFARANNLAAATAYGEYILLLNPDTVVRDAAIDRVLAFALRRPEARLWGGRTIFADGSLNPSSAWARMSIWGLACRTAGLTGLAPRTALFNPEAYGSWQRDSERDVDIVSGCFLLIERQLWQSLGGFDASYFMYGEDADLCLRAANLGARPRITPEATIVHLGGASEKVRADKMVRLLTAKSTLIRRYFPKPLVPLGILLQAMWPLSRAIAHRWREKIMKRESGARESEIWREIWQRRSEWVAGYGVAEVPSAAAHSTRAAS